MDYSREDIKKRISPNSRVLIVTHKNPDGDAMGASLGMYNFLKNMGCTVNVVTPNEYPRFLKWLPGNAQVTVFNSEKTKAKNLISKADTVFCLDFNSPGRAGEVNFSLTASKAFKILIDHHPDPEPFVDYTLSDVTVSSTAELVFRFIEWLDCRELIDHAVAESLFTGIMTDTGCFSYNSSQPETYRVLSELMKMGVDKDKVYDRVYDNFSEERMRLLGYCLDKKMVVLPRYSTAYISLTKKEKEKYNFAIGDSEGFVNYPLSIKDISFAALFMENDNGVKLSFRSKGDFSVNDFSRRHFDGGGHKNAAGGESELSMEDTVKKFCSLLPKYFGEDD